MREQMPSSRSADQLSVSRPNKRCAIVECYNRHDEVYLTTVHLMQRLGYEVHVFNAWRNRLKNSFIHARSLRPVIHTRLGRQQVLDAVRAQDFDLVIFNTFEGPAVLECAQQILKHTPAIGFMHNGSFICNKPEYQPFVQNPRLKLMVLAPYIAEHFAHITHAGSMVPVFLFDRPVPPVPRTPGRRRFCVQGYFDPKRRHYGLLIDALKALRGEGRTDFEVYIMGRSFDRSFREFAQLVRDEGLADHVRYTWKGIGYGSYYKLLSGVDFLLPLISPESHPTYFKSKSTSSIAAAVGFNAIPIAHEQLAQYYSIDDIAFTYTTDLLGAMRKALEASDESLASLRAQLESTKERYLSDSLQQLERAVGQLSSHSAESAPAFADDSEIAQSA
jgi:hypothetical protein